MKNDGFTLIELIMIFSLITILLAFSVPKITTDFGYMDKMAEEYLTDVRFIQMEEMKNPASQYRIAVYPNEGRYYVINGSETVKVVRFKDRYKIKYTGNGDLYFVHDGTPVNANTFTIVDTKTKQSKGITVVPATGRTIILE